MLYVTGTPALSGKIHWQFNKDEEYDEEEGLKVSFHYISL
jgi:hypothetical protein